MEELKKILKIHKKQLLYLFQYRTKTEAMEHSDV